MTRPYLILLTVFIVILPLFSKMPWWTAATAVLFLSWHALHRARGTRLPSRVFCLLMMGAGLAGTFFVYDTLVGFNPLVCVITIFITTHLLKPRASRDLFILNFLCYFLLLDHILFSPSWWVVAHMVAGLVLLTALLVGRDDEAGTVGPALARSGKLLLQGAPFLALMIVFFPGHDRHGTGAGEGGARRTGFTEMLSPGQILALVESEEVAFRARLDVPVPPSQLYWRGAVLWDTDGFVWDNRVVLADEAMLPAPASKKTITQEITLEPHLKAVLFGLDVLADAEVLAPTYQRVRRGDGQTLRVEQKIYERTRYRVKSLPRAPAVSLSPEERRRALALPSLTDSRILNLVKAWRAAAALPRAVASGTAVIDLALAHFRDDFAYTLTPGAVLTLEEFLFDARRGFCGHFASAFAVLMRHAGIPTRVVVGYQGGTHNALGDYWIVRQQHAHAWSEVWLEGQGWLRVDPTAAVMPERLASGMALAELAPGLLAELTRRVRLAWDAARFFWQDDVVSSQAEWWRNFLGETVTARRYERYVWLLLMLCALVLASLLVIALPRLRDRIVRRPQDRAVRLYARLCRRLARQGLPRQGHEGPIDYCHRLAPCLHPASHDDITRATEIYVRLHYGRPAPEGTRMELATLKRLAATRLTVNQTSTR